MVDLASAEVLIIFIGLMENKVSKCVKFNTVKWSASLLHFRTDLLFVSGKQCSYIFSNLFVSLKNFTGDLPKYQPHPIML